MNKLFPIETSKDIRKCSLLIIILTAMLAGMNCSRISSDEAGKTANKTDTGSVSINQPPAKPAVPRMRDMPFEQLMQITQGLLDEFWKKTFQELGWSQTFTYNTPKKLIPYTQPSQSPCGLLEMKNAFYCSGDHSIYYDEGFVRSLYTNPGDFSAVTVLAHEWGHSVQKDVGVLGGQKAFYSIQIELQADCYSGAFAKHIFELGYLEEGDLKEGGSTLLNLGDRMDSKWFDQQAHGTPFDRVAYYDKGWKNGVRACVVQQ
jgi:uncharacterized protein